MDTLQPATRLIVACLLFAVGTAAVGLTSNVVTLYIALAASGLCVAPILISGYLLVDTLTPMNARTTTTWANTVSNGGISAGSALVSLLATRISTIAPFLLAAGVVVAVTTLSSRWRSTMNGGFESANLALKPLDRSPPEK
jgi:MFS family permease